MNEDMPRGVYRRKYKRKGYGPGSGRLRLWTCHRARFPYVVQLRIGGKLHTIGYFKTADEAGRAYDEALYLLTDAEIVPWYLRFNSELDFLDSSGEKLRPKHELQFTSDKVDAWWLRTFDDPAKRAAVRAYYTALGISLARELQACAPRRCSKLNLKGVRRGPYNPRLANVLRDRNTP
jgi:hypothetical protein